MGIRSWLYRVARVMGDANAVSKGPGAVGKRIVRKAVYRTAGRGIRKLFK